MSSAAEAKPQAGRGPSRAEKALVVQTKAGQSVAPLDTDQANAPRDIRPLVLAPKNPSSREVPADFIDNLVKAGGKKAEFTLADGRMASGSIDAMKRDGLGVQWVRGKLATPENGWFYFQRQTVAGKAGWLVGHAVLNASGAAFELVRGGQGRGALMRETVMEHVVCAAAQPDYQAAPETHPTNIPNPVYQTVTPLQSLPGATAVIYLDFDGETGPFAYWGDFDAAASGLSNAQIFDVWKLVAEDFVPMNINVTTDRLVYDKAPEGSRVHMIITPTMVATPYSGTSGGSIVGSFNWSGDPVCWAYLIGGKNCAEVISHEVGHTLGLYHHGLLPNQEYYAGHGGTGATSWAPIMGSAYSRAVTQWSHGEYPNASNPTQDDLGIITTVNNNVAYRADDSGDTLATARQLEIMSDNSVSNEGIIETRDDVDAYRFVTSGGAVTLNVSPASTYPNIDLLAELVDAGTGTVIASDNPDLALNATVSTTLAAGEYLLRVSGVGRGDLATGYSDYASLGSYYITGTVAGGQQSQRFSVVENSPAGTVVGTVTPTTSHGGASPAYAITSGNANGAFAIDADTGQLTVANVAAIDFEALSLRWDDPAAFELFVSLTYGNSAWNETVRTVVTVTNVNEAPTVQPASVTIMEHTRAGTKLLRVNGADQDHFDFPTYSITGGNSAGVFSIEPGTGWLTMASDIEITSDTVFNLTIAVADTATPALTASASVTVTMINAADGYEPGRVVRTYFDNITGTAVSDLTGNAAFPNSPTKEEFLPTLHGGTHGTDYGDTMRVHLLPPVTGSYTFWIASSDASELWLGTNDTQASASVVASVATSTALYGWDESPSQQSATVALTAGQPYWLEVRHKKGAGAIASDHVSVAWQGPGISRQIVSGLYLSPVYQNYAPTVHSATFAVREDAVHGQTAGTVTTSDVNRQDTFGSYAITAGNTGGVFGIDASTGRLFVATPGVLNAGTTPVYTLTVAASDNGAPPLGGTATVTVNVLAATGVNAAGIIQQRWSAIIANVAALLALPSYPYQPTSTVTYASFSTASQSAINYGSRIQALLTPTVSGTYTFYMSSNDDAELWFSTNASGAGATRIINNVNNTPYDNFAYLPAQQTSAPVALTAGQTYYLQTLHHQGGGTDHVQVAWTGPGISTPTIIPGSVLTAFDLNATPSFASGSYSWSVASNTTNGTVVGSVSATDPELETPVYAILSGNTAGTFAIDPLSGAISVANAAGLVQGTVFNLQVAAQDRGIGWVYPLRSGLAMVTITVPLPNMPPTGPASITKPDATRGVAYSSSLAGDFTDPNPGDVLTFTKQSGPAWLGVSTSGALSGTPGVGDVGANQWTIRVTDSGGLFIDTVLHITVQTVNNPPVWTLHSFTKPNGTIGSAYSSSVASDATDPDAGDTLTFSKTSGPAWLSVAGNGALSGTPAITDVGVNSWSVRVTDAGGLFDTATLQITVTAPPLGAPWSTADIGTTGRTGATVTGGGVFNQAGAGVGVNGTADAFQFASQPLTADGEFRARLTALGGPANANAGVMLRDGTATGAKVAWMSVKAGNFTFSSRATTGGSATAASVAAANAMPNNWLRLTRSGGVITAYRSADGTTWTNSGSLTLSGVTTMLAGLATSSGDTSNLATSTFDNVQITPFPSQWITQQLGTVTATGRAEYFASAYTLNGAGVIGGTGDAGLLCQQTMSGDGEISARITSMQNTGTSARAGIMIRDTTATGAKSVFMGISPDGTYRYQYRTKASSADTTVTGGTGTLPNVWVKLTRSGNTINGYKSSDGVNWTLVSSKSVALGSGVVCGIIVGSGSTTTLCGTVFDNVVFTP
ncbi:MAG: cadherin domain-containing protein [Verrucomicrobiaceae bacterium]|nr:cadherin domain-containing protein [Verrucomicrobiaceae bacterium]